MIAVPPASSVDSQTSLADKAYILGFEDGTEAVTNAVNAEMCASHYAQQGQGPGPECHKFYENFKLRVARYNKIKKDLVIKENKDGKNSAGNKKNPNKRAPNAP